MIFQVFPYILFNHVLMKDPSSTTGIIKDSSSLVHHTYYHTHTHTDTLPWEMKSQQHPEGILWSLWRPPGADVESLPHHVVLTSPIREEIEKLTYQCGDEQIWCFCLRQLTSGSTHGSKKKTLGHIVHTVMLRIRSIYMFTHTACK